MQEKHLSQQQVADRWSVSPRTLEKWRWDKIGPRYLKIGNRVVYRIADIEEYEKSCLRETLQREKAASNQEAPHA